MSVCMCVLKRDISFPSDSKLTQPLPRYQFKFRIRTDYFGLVFPWKRHKNNFKLPSPWWWQRSQKWSPSDVDDNRVGGHLAMEATRRREAGEPRMRFAPNSWAVALHPLNHNHHHVISWYGQSSELRIWPHNTQCVHWSVFPQGCWTLNISEKMLVWTYFF